MYAIPVPPKPKTLLVALPSWIRENVIRGPGSRHGSGKIFRLARSYRSKLLARTVRMLDRAGGHTEYLHTEYLHLEELAISPRNDEH